MLKVSERLVGTAKQVQRDAVPELVEKVRSGEVLLNAVTALKAERDENRCREEMTPSEMLSLGKELEELERPKANERQANTGTAPGRPKQPDNAHGKFPQASPGTTRDKVGEALGMSGRQYQRMKKVAQDGAPELLEALDRGEVSVNGEGGRVVPPGGRTWGN